MLARYDFTDVFDLMYNHRSVIEPKVWVEKENKYVLALEVPGVPEDKIDLIVEDRIIQLRAFHQDDEIGYEKKYVFRETLPKKANAETISAKIKNGILIVSVEKNPAEAKRTVKVLAE